jgi:2-oxoglutarate/2-oxoacid ferredoxin oxidoreductase subunit alpha
MSLDVSILVGGEAGQGIQTIGFVLGKTMVRSGLHVFADQDYESRIRGGHNFFRVRVSDREVKSQDEKLDILVALNKETVDLHRHELKENGVIVLDASALQVARDGSEWLDIPLEKLALETASEKIMSNSVAVGAVLGLLRGDIEVLAGVLRWHFTKNAAAIQENNIRAARAGFLYAGQRIPPQFTAKCNAGKSGRRMFLNGNEALSLGTISAGCKFVSIYPMTPITSILEYIAERGKSFNIAVLQPEDEISAINMVVGAGYAGVRAMTATSGSGFVLMIEGIGLAGITETPVVVVLGQRPGPAVGLPTRTEQGELLLAIHGGTGEFPRAVLAPATAEDAFYLTAKAFNLAEKYQTPVIILTDTHLANSYTDTEIFDLKQVRIERGALLSDEEAGKLNSYQRYRITESGISPRALPMQSESLVVADGDEHDENGHLTEKADMRYQQVAKRMRKNEILKHEIGQPRIQTVPEAEITLIGWGSTYGAITEAASLLQKEGVRCNVLHLCEIWPFPAEKVAAVIGQSRKSLVIENNATGQLASLIRSETGFTVSGKINKWDGRPVSAGYIIDALKKEIR